MEEILVKGSDGKWYIARDGKLVPQDAAVTEAPAVAMAVAVPTPLAPKPRENKAVPPVIEPAPVKTDKPREQKIEPFKKALQIIEKPVLKPTPPVALKVSLTAPHAARQASMDDMELTIAKTYDAAGLSFNDPSLQKRFKLLIASRLREVRRSQDVPVLLERDSKVGGMGLSAADASRVAGIIEVAFSEYHKKWQQVEEERKKAVAAEREKAARATAAVMARESETPAPKQTEAKAVSAPVLDEALKKQNLPSLPKGVLKEVVREVTPFTPSVNKKNATRIAVAEQPISRAAAVAKKTASAPTIPAAASVTDIRRPKLLGPADEIRELKLIDWRRMGLATEAAMRVKAKIDLIGSESLASRRAAIAAWKQSEVYTLYTDMATRSIAQGHSIDSEISQRMKNKQLCLNLDEFSAIMELNQALR